MQVMKKLSKGRVLLDIKDRLTVFAIPDLLVFKASEFRSEAAILDEIGRHFAGATVVVRSSAADEDGLNSAMAGEYDSVLNVPSDQPEALRKAIAQVVSSYSRTKKCHIDNEIIVQRMVTDVCMSGVVFTHDLNTGAPYYVINYDDVSGLTNTVTSGDGAYANRTLYIHRGALDALRSDRFHRLMSAIRELEMVMESQFLDVEFALDSKLTPYLLQVRAITTQPNWNRGVARRIDLALKGIQAFVAERFRPTYGVYGATTVLGQMPDWNPAEMIGRAPRALAFSLYKLLITDHAWRLGREMMGYSVPAGQPLMVSLAGQPFIDTRLSFHSFTPAALPAEIATKLVNAWIKRLTENPELHDKIEFDVAITSYSFDLEEKLQALRDGVLSEDECCIFKEALHRQTKTLLDPAAEGSIERALARVEALAARQHGDGRDAGISDLSRLHDMVEDCVRLGTIPFSILARHGFIAKTFLVSLCRRGVLSEQEMHAIQSGIRTVASELVKDMHRLQSGVLDRNAFMARYGHLRPGTYDILSRRYDLMPEFGEGNAKASVDTPEAPAILSEETRQRIDDLLAEEGFLEWDTHRLLGYVQAATAGREYGKFVFTRTVSDILELVADFGEKHGLSREEMSHVSLQHLLDAHARSSEGSVEERLRAIAEEEAERHSVSVAIRLPQVLFDEAGVHVVPFQISHPNFITQRKVTAPVVRLSPEENNLSIAGKIVLIENADPGFDWIFSREIAGLITKYGGANSHMAIRCAEFGIPAAIGCGEQRFEVFLKAQNLAMDCAAGLINPHH